MFVKYKPYSSILVLSFILSCFSVNLVNADNYSQNPSVNNNHILTEKAYTMNEIIRSGNKFFGTASGGLARVFSRIFSSYGAPNAYILGSEASAAFIGGLTYGKGAIYSKTGQSYRVYWSGPSIGFDAGGQGSRLMILVYRLKDISELWGRYAGIAGSAYVVAGAGFNVLQSGDVLLVPVRTGVGVRMGLNIGYLKLTPRSTMNPF